LRVFDLAVFLLFWLMLACNFAVAWTFGRRVERAFALGLVLVSVLPPAMRITFERYEWTWAVASGTDWAILAIAWYLALRSDRYWPMWFAAMQTLAVFTEVLSWAHLDTQQIVFANFAAFWSLPALLSMTCGTILDQRHSVDFGGKPRSTSA